MFEIIDNVIHLTRGDIAPIDISTYEKDSNGYIKFQNGENEVYWYDRDNDELYDAEYVKSAVSIEDLTPQLHVFEPNDVIRFKVMTKSRTSNVLLEKTVTVTKSTQYVSIDLTGEETKIGNLINKPTTYWYEVELNPDTSPQTILGYDKPTGPKLLILYPEGGDVNE